MSPEASLVERIAAGDEAAFLSLVERYHQAVTWVAGLYADGEAAAQALAGDAWRVVLEELPAWSGRSLGGFVFAIVGRVGRRVERPRATVTALALAGPATSQPLRAAIDALPPLERALIAVRDVAGCSADEACVALALAEPEQRRVLHRARTALTHAVGARLAGDIAA